MRCFKKPLQKYLTKEEKKRTLKPILLLWNTV